MNVKDFGVGDRVYVLRYNAYRSKEPKIIEKIVEKVGKKYVYVCKEKNTFEQCFEKHDMRENCLIEKTTLNDKDLLFATLEDVNDYIDFETLKRWFWKLEANELTLNQLRKIKDIVDKK